VAETFRESDLGELTSADKEETTLGAAAGCEGVLSAEAICGVDEAAGSVCSRRKRGKPIIPTTRISAPTSAGITKVARPGVRWEEGAEGSAACTFNLGNPDEGAAGSLERGMAGSGDKGTLRGEMPGEAGSAELDAAGEGGRGAPPPAEAVDPTAAEKAAEGAGAATGSATPRSRAAI